MFSTRVLALVSRLSPRGGGCSIIKSSRISTEAAWVRGGEGEGEGDALPRSLPRQPMNLYEKRPRDDFLRREMRKGAECVARRHPSRGAT